MADELSIAVHLAFNKGNKTPELSWPADQFDVSGTDYIRHTQSIGTTAEALDIGDITTPGYIAIKNLDSSNFVEIRMGSTGADVVKLKAGEFALFRLASTTPYAIADTAACEVEYLLIED